jgi:ribokinase
MAIKILVIGSINIDEVNYIKKFPLIGETIVVDEFFEFHGGKGANQAVATRRLINEKKHEVFLFAKVGNDDYGDKAIKNLKKDNINTQYVFKSKTKPTGKAIILISYLEKDNKIIINKGANEDFGDNDLNNLEEAIKECDIIVMQLEVNEFLIENALKIAKKNKKIVIMNPSPATTFNNK